MNRTVTRIIQTRRNGFERILRASCPCVGWHRVRLSVAGTYKHMACRSLKGDRCCPCRSLRCCSWHRHNCSFVLMPSLARVVCTVILYLCGSTLIVATRAPLGSCYRRSYRPDGVQNDPPNLSISVGGGKESNYDCLSNGERNGKLGVCPISASKHDGGRLSPVTLQDVWGMRYSTRWEWACKLFGIIRDRR